MATETNLVAAREFADVAHRTMPDLLSQLENLRHGQSAATRHRVRRAAPDQPGSTAVKTV